MDVVYVAMCGSAIPVRQHWPVIVIAKIEPEIVHRR